MKWDSARKQDRKSVFFQQLNSLPAQQPILEDAAAERHDTEAEPLPQTLTDGKNHRGDGRMKTGGQQGNRRMTPHLVNHGKQHRRGLNLIMRQFGKFSDMKWKQLPSGRVMRGKLLRRVLQADRGLAFISCVQTDAEQRRNRVE